MNETHAVTVLGIIVRVPKDRGEEQHREVDISEGGPCVGTEECGIQGDGEGVEGAVTTRVGSCHPPQRTL